MLLRELSDNEDDMGGASQGSTAPDDPSQLWMRDFCSYLDAHEHVPMDWLTIEWWGVCDPI